MLTLLEWKLLFDLTKSLFDSLKSARDLIPDTPEAKGARDAMDRQLMIYSLQFQEQADINRELDRLSSLSEHSDLTCKVIEGFGDLRCRLMKIEEHVIATRRFHDKFFDESTPHPIDKYIEEKNDGEAK